MPDAVELQHITSGMYRVKIEGKPRLMLDVTRDVFQPLSSCCSALIGALYGGEGVLRLHCDSCFAVFPSDEIVLYDVEEWDLTEELLEAWGYDVLTASLIARDLRVLYFSARGRAV